MLPKFFIFRRHTVFTGKNQRLLIEKQRFPVGKQRLLFFKFKFKFRPALLVTGTYWSVYRYRRSREPKWNPGRARNQPTETGDCLVAWATEVGWVGLDFVRGGNPRFKSASPAGGRAGGWGQTSWGPGWTGVWLRSGRSGSRPPAPLRWLVPVKNILGGSRVDRGGAKRKQPHRHRSSRRVSRVPGS